MSTCAKLRFTNNLGEKFYFVAMGDNWPNNPERFLVRKTTNKPEKARCFPTAKEAADTLILIGNGVGWDIIVEEA